MTTDGMIYQIWKKREASGCEPLCDCWWLLWGQHSPVASLWTMNLTCRCVIVWCFQHRSWLPLLSRCKLHLSREMGQWLDSTKSGCTMYCMLFTFSSLLFVDRIKTSLQKTWLLGNMTIKTFLWLETFCGTDDYFLVLQPFLSHFWSKQYN